MGTRIQLLIQNRAVLGQHLQDLFSSQCRAMTLSQIQSHQSRHQSCQLRIQKWVILKAGYVMNHEQREEKKWNGLKQIEEISCSSQFSWWAFDKWNMWKIVEHPWHTKHNATSGEAWLAGTVRLCTSCLHGAIRLPHLGATATAEPLGLCRRRCSRCSCGLRK